MTALAVLWAVVGVDRAYMGTHVNGRIANFFGLIYLLIIMVVALTAIPLMILTNQGQG